MINSSALMIRVQSLVALPFHRAVTADPSRPTLAKALRSKGDSCASDGYFQSIRKVKMFLSILNIYENCVVVLTLYRFRFKVSSSICILSFAASLCFVSVSIASSEELRSSLS